MLISMGEVVKQLWLASLGQEWNPNVSVSPNFARAALTARGHFYTLLQAWFRQTQPFKEYE